jgi:hypothetical protein
LRERIGDVLNSFRCVLELVWRDQVYMRRPPEIEVIRKAYELWEQSGKPEGRDQEVKGAHRTAGPDHVSGSSDPMYPKPLDARLSGSLRL